MNPDAARLSRWWTLLNPPPFRACAIHRLLLQRVAAGSGIAMPRMLGFFEPHWGRTIDGAPLRDAADVERLLASRPSSRVFPAERALGAPALDFPHEDGPATTEELVAFMLGDAYNPTRYPQAGHMLRLFVFEEPPPSNAPRVRVVVLQDSDERCRVLWHTAAPATDRDTLSELSAFALRCAEAFAPLRAIEWEIALTAQGPLLVSAEPEWTMPEDAAPEALRALEGTVRRIEVQKHLEATEQGHAVSVFDKVLRATRLAAVPRAFRFARQLAVRGRRAARESGRGLMKLAAEQAQLYRQHHLHRSEYYWYRLYDRSLAWEDKTAYIGGRAAPRFWRTFNPERFWTLIEWKPFFHAYAETCDIPVARIYGIFHKDRGATRDGASLRTADDLRAWLAARGACDFVIKPVHSSQGSLVLVLHHDPDGTIRDIAGATYTAEELVHHMTDEASLRTAYPYPGPVRYDFLLLERLEQHPSVAALTGSRTLCSCRVLTALTHAGTVTPITALFKLQPHDTGVDNASQGAMIVSVDLESGELGEGVYMHLKDYRESARYRRHPDGGETFTGFRLPQWDDLLAVAAHAAGSVPMLRAVGWDIALTTRGPVVLEGNVRWGVESLQLAQNRGLNRGRFGEIYGRLAL
jgi:hypothetical protein